MGEGGDRQLGPGFGFSEHGIDPGPARVGGISGQGEEHALADLRLPAADGPAAARASARVDREVADLAREAGRPRQQAPVDDEAAADADLAGHVQHVVDADGRAAPRLTDDARVGVVHHRDRKGGRESTGEARAERDVDPAQVGGHRHHAVVAPDHARDRDADSDDGPVVALRQVGDEGREVGDDNIDRELDPGPVDTDPLEHLATEADDGNRDRVHEDL